MEYLDIYDEEGNYIGKEDRKIVHEKALWHKTVHCWLYDKKGNIYFQERKDEGTLYTTASGHIKAGESVQEGFGREVEEEIGIKVNYEKSKLVEIVKFTLDKEKKDGTIFKDRAFANAYACVFDDSIEAFSLDAEEVTGLVKINAQETLSLLEKEEGKIKGIRIDAENKETEIIVTLESFLVNKGETAIGKYGEVLRKVIEFIKEDANNTK